MVSLALICLYFSFCIRADVKAMVRGGGVAGGVPARGAGVEAGSGGDELIEWAPAAVGLCRRP